MRRPLFQIAALAVLFTALYFGLRALPATNCQFLHYEQPLVTEDGVEYCASGQAMFVDLSRLQFPVTLQLTPEQPLVAGEPVRMTLQLNGTGGRPFRPSELAVTHTRKLHLLLVDPTLEDYQHIHPEPEGDAGKWTFTFTPRRAGEYRAFSEVVPLRTRRQVLGEAQLAVAGEPAPGAARGLEHFVDDGYTYSLQAPALPAVAGADVPLILSVSRGDGAPVKLEPVMGALAHVVAFDSMRRGYAHLHPVYTGRETDAVRPELSFLFNTRVPGRYRVWAQVKIDGRERFAPFDLDVQPADS